MSEQSAKDTILNKTLHVLVRELGLPPDEVAQLRLSQLHLAGRSPNISFTPAGSTAPKTVELDLDAHRALVGWLVSRPDSVTDFLFPGSGAEAMDPLEIQHAVDEIEKGRVQIAGKAAEETEAADRPPGLDETEPAPGEATWVSRSRPIPPPSRPEMGAPPRGLADTTISPFGPPSSSPPPPPTAPEVDESVNIPLPSSMPRPKPPPVTPPEAKATPIKPAAPVDKETPAKPAEPVDKEMPVEPAAPVDKEVEETLAIEPTVASAEQEEVKTGSPPLKKRKARPDNRARPEEKEVKTPARPTARKKRKPTAEEAARPAGERSPGLARLVIPAVAVAALLLCAVCVGGGWFAWQSIIDSQLLAGLGLSRDALEEEGFLEPTEDDEAGPDAVVFQSPISLPPTPTLPPTATPTALPPTATPPPTETATPISTDTPLPPPTDTPIPSDTPLPADTPTPAETATPTDTPTPAMKYAAPVLLEPEDDFDFISGNTIVLRWQPVGELAPDEQYAVRMVYRFNNETTFQGTNIKETEWTVPLSLFGQIDPPENRYEWFVVVERLNDDGSGTAISPESQRRTFTWR